LLVISQQSLVIRDSLLVSSH